MPMPAVPRLLPRKLQREPAMQADVFGGVLGVFHRPPVRMGPSTSRA